MTRERIDTSGLPDARIWAIGCALAGLVAAFILTPGYTLLSLTLPFAAIIGGIVGWKWARRRLLRLVIERIQEKGGSKWLLDQKREMLRLWIPLNHELTEDDK